MHFSIASKTKCPVVGTDLNFTTPTTKNASHYLSQLHIRIFLRFIYVCEPLGIEYFTKLPEIYEVYCCVLLYSNDLTIMPLLQERLCHINELPGDSEIFGLLLGNDNTKLPRGVSDPNPSMFTN